MAPVKRLMWITSLLLFIAFHASAQTLYVSEIKEFSIRSGPGTDFKIIGVISTGQPIVVIETSGNWSKIQTPQGKEGWLLSRFLKKEAPIELPNNTGQRKSDSDGIDPAALTAENAQLKEKTAALELELSTIKEAFKRLETNYEFLKKDAADVIGLRNKIAESEQLLSSEKSRADKFENEFIQLYNDQRMKWFLIGAAVILVGFFIGFVSKSSRRRTSLR